MSTTPKPKKMGRPKKPGGQDVLVAGRVPPATADALDTFARKHKINRSEALRRVIDASMIIADMKPPADSEGEHERKGAVTDLPDWTTDALNDRPTAIHEAGHAVMACRLNIPFRCVTIDPAVAEGHNGGLMDPHFIVTSRREAHVSMLFALAGYFACEVANVANYGWDTDVIYAQNTARIWWKDDDPIAAYNNAKACAEDMLRNPENRAAVERLAILLIEHRTLDADAVRACVAQAGDAPNSPNPAA